MWHKQSPWIRSKIAVDLSHYRLLERIVNTGRPAVILEDDAALTGTQWLPDLLTALQELPQVSTTKWPVVGWGGGGVGGGL